VYGWRLLHTEYLYFHRVSLPLVLLDFSCDLSTSIQWSDISQQRPGSWRFLSSHLCTASVVLSSYTHSSRVNVTHKGNRHYFPASQSSWHCPYALAITGSQRYQSRATKDLSYIRRGFKTWQCQKGRMFKFYQLINFYMELKGIQWILLEISNYFFSNLMMYKDFKSPSILSEHSWLSQHDLPTLNVDLSIIYTNGNMRPVELFQEWWKGTKEEWWRG
jgi:hypothetical protein